MADKYWFEPKRHGWGFVPNSRNGWLATLVLLILILITTQTNGVFSGKISADRILRLFFDIFVITTVFTITMQSKVKGGLKWRWNGSKKKRRKRR